MRVLAISPQRDCSRDGTSVRRLRGSRWSTPRLGRINTRSTAHHQDARAAGRQRMSALADLKDHPAPAWNALISAPPALILSTG